MRYTEPDIKIDKELLRFQLEAEGYDTSQMDMDLAVEYEKAKIWCWQHVACRESADRNGQSQRHCKLAGLKDLEGFGSTLPPSHVVGRECELDYTQV